MRKTTAMKMTNNASMVKGKHIMPFNTLFSYDVLLKTDENIGKQSWLYCCLKFL